jgi:hypothetical protein
VLLHVGDGARDGTAVRQALLADERRAHVRDGRDPIVVGEIVRLHQADSVPLGIESAHVEEPEIGAAAAARAEDPGSDGEGFDVVEGELSHVRSR